MELHKIAYNFLISAGVEVSRGYLKERLKSHPDYPALNSLTDILDELQINSHAISLKQKNRWKEINLPFLAHVISDNGKTDLELINTHNSIESEEIFFKKWTGIVLYITNNKIIHEEHDQRLRREKTQRGIIFWVVFLTYLLLTTYQIVFFNQIVFIHFILCSLGLAISIVIIAHGMGLKTDFANVFCKVEESGCNKVLNSKLGRFAGDYGLGDVSSIYFCSHLLFISFSIHFDKAQNLFLLSIIQTFALIFTPVSIFYQLQLRSWCKLCFFIISIVWIQTINLYRNYFEEELSFPEISLELYILFGISFALSTFWLVIKPLKMQEKEIIYQRIRIRKWRQDPSWFNALLPLHKQIDDTTWQKEIYYGNSSGILQILIVSDPYCSHCAIAHRELGKIVQKHPKDIGVRIRFTLKTFEPTDGKYQAVFSIYNAYESLVWNGESKKSASEYRKQIIDDWYQNQNLEIWNLTYGTEVEDKDEINRLIRKSVSWSRKMEVKQTPAFFVNGYEMPNPHTFKDLFIFATEYIEILQKEANSEFAG